MTPGPSIAVAIYVEPPSVACSPATVGEIEALAGEVGVAVRRVGEVGGGTLLGVELQRLRSAYEREHEA